jgi:hypothetical protein
MTYARDPESWPGAITRAVSALGAARAAEAAEVSESRLRQLANPCRSDWRVLESLARLDAACLDAGHGAPIGEFWIERLGPRSTARLANVQAWRARGLEAAMT